MQAFGHHLGRRGFGYMAGLSLLVIMVGAAGMYAFERDAPHPSGFDSYGTALWWTAMLLTTMGSDYWPKTPAGRLLCWVLSLYAFAVFGYVTALLASLFMGHDAADDRVTLAGKASVEGSSGGDRRAARRGAPYGQPAGVGRSRSHGTRTAIWQPFGVWLPLGLE